MAIRNQIGIKKTLSTLLISIAQGTNKEGLLLRDIPHRADGRQSEP